MNSSALNVYDKLKLAGKHPLLDVAKYLAVIAALTLLMLNGTERLGYFWQWYRVPKYIFSFTDGQYIPGPLIEGLKITFRITAISLLLAFTFGLISALMRLSQSFVAKTIARVYLETIRNTPLLDQVVRQKISRD